MSAISYWSWLIADKVIEKIKVVKFFGPKYVFCGVPNCTLDVLQRTQNASARLIFQLKLHEHLHWLPIRYRVWYKLYTLMYTIHQGQSPAYLSEQVNTAATQTLRSEFRSASTTNYATSPRLRSSMNELLHTLDRQHGILCHTNSELLLLTTLNSFKRRLKHVFLMPKTHRRRDSTVELSRVGGVYCTRFATIWRQSRRVWTNLPTAKSSCIVSTLWTHPSAVVTQFTIFCAATAKLLRLVTSGDIMTSLLKGYQYWSKFT